MSDVVVFETTHDVCDRIGFADVTEKLVAQALALRRPGDKPGDIDEFHRRRDDFLRLHDIGQLLQARIRYLDHADVGIDGAKRIVFRRDPGPGQGIEQRRLAHVGQSDDATFETHSILSQLCRACIAFSMLPS